MSIDYEVNGGETVAPRCLLLSSFNRFHIIKYPILTQLVQKFLVG